MSDAPSNKGLIPTVIAVVGAFLVFYIVLQSSRHPAAPVATATNAPAEEQWKLTAEGRKARLGEVRATAQSAATSYAWVDKGAGVVRLPVDRAMQLTVDEINAKKQ